MNQAANLRPVESSWQERPLGKTVLRTYRSTVDIDTIEPNPQQPRLGPKEDPELQRQIDANEGIFEPLLVEPHPSASGKLRIIDGERRWTNAKVLVEQHQKNQYRQVPVEITDRTLSDEERYRTWVYIHRQRKEWDAREKEMVAYRLVDLVGRASAANILGLTVREIDKLVEIYELSLRLTNLREPGAAITWAREIKNLNKSLLSPDVVDAIVDKVNRKEVTNSKDVRKLRTILRDPVAKATFLSDRGSIERAILVVPAPVSKPVGLVADLEQLASAVRRYPWTTLNTLRGNTEVLARLSETEKLLEELRRLLEDESLSGS